MRLSSLYKRLAGIEPNTNWEVNPSVKVDPGQVIQFNNDADSYYKVIGLLGGDKTGHNSIKIIESDIDGKLIEDAESQILSFSQHQEAFHIVNNSKPQSAPRKCLPAIMSILTGKSPT